jgi:amidase
VKTVPKNNLIYTFSPSNKPAETVQIGERVLLQTEDAFGGQLSSGQRTLESLDWAKVDGATGPIYIQGASPGDTLIAEILDIRTAEEGVIVTVPKQGLLGKRRFKSLSKVVRLKNGIVQFDDEVLIKTNPMIGTIGVAPKSTEIPSSSLGRHGGNLDTKQVTAGSKMYFPVFVEGALFAAGDLHALQADGELCVSSVEVTGEISVKFGLIKNQMPKWPILETEDEYSVLSCGRSLEEACQFAVEASVTALMREHHWSFEQAYMFGSLAVNLRINQVVDPKKGVRAAISKEFISLDSYLD